jgi:hypothetical protein
MKHIKEVLVQLVADKIETFEYKVKFSSTELEKQNYSVILENYKKVLEKLMNMDNSLFNGEK